MVSQEFYFPFSRKLLQNPEEGLSNRRIPSRESCGEKEASLCRAHPALPVKLLVHGSVCVQTQHLEACLFAGSRAPLVFSSDTEQGLGDKSSRPSNCLCCKFGLLSEPQTSSLTVALGFQAGFPSEMQGILLRTQVPGRDD